MRTKDKINNLKTRAAELEQKITAIQADLDECELNGDICPFCGTSRQLIHRVGEIDIYEKCGCDRFASEHARHSRLRSERDDLRVELETIRLKLNRHERIAHQMLTESNLGRRFQERTFETFDNTRFPAEYKAACEYAESFEDNDGKGIMFIGSVGTGKTHLAAAITNHIITEFSIPVRFITSIELFGLLRDFEKNAGAIEGFKNAPILVLDDLGKEKVTDWNREKLFEIINFRYENYLPVIITTNGNMTELEKQIGAAVYSRLCEMCDLAVMAGKDYRR